jgi:DNA-binding SARP family transcriptional activator/predicted Ser/Thr protein kinase
MAVIEFRTLGALDLRSTEGHQLHSLLAQPKRVALLTYLCIANPGGFHRRDSLLGLFWPDADESHARTSLRNALHVLRHSLGDAALISRGDEEIAINSELVWCDAVAFTQKVGSDGVEDAIDLYRGDFLAGFFLDDTPEFEHWVETERARLRALAARAARVSAERHEKEQHLTDAIGLARRAVQLTDTDERAIRRLIELLARAGDRAGALQAYDSFERRLADQLGAEPSDETRRVIERIRREQVASGEVRAAPVAPSLVAEADRLDIPGYSVERELGRGGMSTVFVGRDIKHDRRVAIKVLRPDVAAVLGADRFLTEISIASRLNHPHILPLLDSGKANGLPFYVMPYTDGETLRTRLRRERILSVEEAVRIATEVADALGYAHGLGIVHRDIKPENIVLENGHALVTDFGIARALTQASEQRLTQPGLAIGTAAYMSPEQADDGAHVDARTDVYALACVLYEMITGDPPFTGSNFQSVLARKATEPARPLRGVRETISPELERTTLKALSRIPADRYSTVQEFADALKQKPSAGSWPKPRAAFAGPAISAAAILIVVAGFAVAREKMQPAIGSHFALKDRKQITNTGRVGMPALSPDGKTLAYVTLACRVTGCTGAIELQDVDGSASRQLVDSISEVMTPGLEWSPDRRNLLAHARIKGQTGYFLISTLNGAVRFIGTSGYEFLADGDSLVAWRPKPRGKFWVLVSGLDGVPRDSFPVGVNAEELDGVIPVPGSSWMIGAFWVEAGINWVAFDRNGKIGGRLPARHGGIPTPRASSDAFWVGTRRNLNSAMFGSVIRIPFDASTGQFAAHEDTVFTGSSSSMGVSASGRTFVVDDGTTEYTLWKMTLPEALSGRYPEKGRWMTGTSELTNEISPDGHRIIVGRPAGSGSGMRWEVFPYDSGPATPLSGTPAGAIWADSNSAILQTDTPRGTQLSLVNVITGVQRGTYLVPDTAIGAFAPLREEGWVWMTDTAVRVYRRGSSVRTFPLPKWYFRTGSVDASRDGGKLLFVGRSQKRDSVRLSSMSLSDGTVTNLKTVVGGFTAAGWLNDGSIIFLVWDTPDWLTL